MKFHHVLAKSIKLGYECYNNPFIIRLTFLFGVFGKHVRVHKKNGVNRNRTYLQHKIYG